MGAQFHPNAIEFYDGPALFRIGLIATGGDQMFVDGEGSAVQELNAAKAQFFPAGSDARRF